MLLDIKKNDFKISLVKVECLAFFKFMPVYFSCGTFYYMILIDAIINQQDSHMCIINSQLIVCKIAYSNN